MNYILRQRAARLMLEDAEKCVLAECKYIERFGIKGLQDTIPKLRKALAEYDAVCLFNREILNAPELRKEQDVIITHTGIKK